MYNDEDFNYEESVLFEFNLAEVDEKVFARVSWLKKDELLIIFTCNPFKNCKYEWVHDYVLRYTDLINQSERSSFMRESIRSNLKVAVSKAIKLGIVNRITSSN